MSPEAVTGATAAGVALICHLPGLLRMTLAHREKEHAADRRHELAKGGEGK